MDFDEPAIGDQLVVETIGLNFKVVVILPKNFSILSGCPSRAFQILLSNEIGNFSAQTSGQSNETFVVLLQQLLVHPGFVVEALKIRLAR